MVKVFIYQAVFVLILIAARPLTGYGKGPGMPADTIPVQEKPAEKTAEKPQGQNNIPELIKEVPKSRRMVKPIAVPSPLPVKPIKIIKPKIITRTVGVIR